MKEYTYQGKHYRRSGAMWVDDNNMVVPVALQSALNALAFAQTDISTLSYAEAKAEGDKCKASESYSYAIQYYEQAFLVAETYMQTSVLLPRITSSYRKLHRPEKVIEILAKAKKAYGERIINEALLTSAAAAYCDMGQPENALKCCNYAYAKTKNKKQGASGELLNVYERAKRMMELK